MKDSIEVPIACIRCRKYGRHVIECRKKEKEKDKKEKIKIKVKQEIKEENPTDINEHNIVEIIKEFSNPMIDPLDPPTDKEVTDINVSNNNNKFDR